MSVLIKGMEMPKGKALSLIIYPEGDITVNLKSTSYKAVEVPTPHGRLIDADELEERVKQTMRYFSIKYDIQEAPTVIEREE